ncbi:MAG: hypothetical protein HC879_20215 [Leptolyngbyaceae cyanobacterium SL_5_9]|nr:hypothetical protein [Leptolyngbyaceae cyanobacterium SM1_4_3]NJN59637.1 hypothetical protein [Leptolyngbyaceae cyanobacterium SL_5_9]
MNWYSQLTQLILDFYREDLTELKQLDALQSCHISRRWGVLRVNCRTQDAASALTAAGHILKEPVAQLRLAQQIKILLNGSLVAALPVDPSRLIK